ncbi:MAG: hypothetical protein JXA73_17910 [Acidobacteria bacterium]|nr:hypothetical protein [Acidobacteriota bacterium]
MQKDFPASEAFPLIHSWADQTPGAIALLAPGREPLSFSRFLRRIEASEQALDRCGIGPNEVVALALPDGAEMAAAVVGVGRTRSCAPLNLSLAASEFKSYLLSLRPSSRHRA